MDLLPKVDDLFAFAAIARTVGHLSKSAEVMKLVNNLMKAPEVAVTMQEFNKEMTKVCLQLMLPFWIKLFIYRGNNMCVRLIELSLSIG